MTKKTRAKKSTSAGITTAVNNNEDTHKGNLKSNSKSKPKVEEQVPPETPAISLPPVTLVNVIKAEFDKGSGTSSHPFSPNNHKQPQQQTSQSSSKTLSAATTTAYDDPQNQNQPSSASLDNSNNYNSNKLTNTNKEQLKSKLFKTKSKPKVSLNVDRDVDLLSVLKLPQNQQQNQQEQQRERLQPQQPNNNNNNNDPPTSVNPGSDPDPESQKLLVSSRNQNIRNYQSTVTTAPTVPVPDPDPKGHQNQNLYEPISVVSHVNGTTTYYIDSTQTSTNTKTTTTPSKGQNKNQSSHSRSPFQPNPNIMSESSSSSGSNIFHSETKNTNPSAKINTNITNINSRSSTNPSNDSSKSKSKSRSNVPPKFFEPSSSFHDPHHHSTEDKDGDNRQKNLNGHTYSNSKGKTGVIQNEMLLTEPASATSFHFELFERTLDNEIQIRENPNQIFVSELEQLDRDFQNSISLTKTDPRSNPIISSQQVSTTGAPQSTATPNSNKCTDVCIDMSLLEDYEPDACHLDDGKLNKNSISLKKELKSETKAKAQTTTTALDDRASSSSSSVSSLSSCSFSSPPLHQNQSKTAHSSHQVPQTSDSFADLRKLLALSKAKSNTNQHTDAGGSSSSESASTSSSSTSTSASKKNQKSYAKKLDLEEIKRRACAYAIANNPNSKIRINPSVSLSQSSEPLSLLSAADQEREKKEKLKLGKDSKKCKDKDSNDVDVEEILGLDLGHENHRGESGCSGVGASAQGQSYELYSVPEDVHFLPNSGASNSQHAKVNSGSEPLLKLPISSSTSSFGLGSVSIGKSSVSNIIASSSSLVSSGSGSGPGGLAACCSILDGINNLCEVQTCSKPASKKCASCKSAYYCSEDHQKCDWRKHKNQCIPYKMEVKSSDDVSVMVAVRNIPAGKLIFAEKPFLLFPVASFDTDFVHVMDLNCVMSSELLHTCGAKTPACLGCMKCVEFIGAKRHECSKCGLPLCSKQCEYEMSHQIGECQVIANCGDLKLEEKPPSCFHSLYLDVEILRALQLEALYPSEWEKFLQLRRHVRVELYKKSERYGKFVGNTKRLVPYSAKVSGYNFDLIRDVHAIITALSFKPSLRSPYKMLIGTQLYFDHSCVPNTIHYVEHQVTGHVNKMRCVVKAAMPIMKGDVISLDFVPTPYLAYLLRRRVLENLCLNCSCRRCVQPSEIGDHSGDITCPNCRRGLVTPERPLEWKESIWSCRACQEEVPYSQVTQIYQDWRNQLYGIPRTRKSIDNLYNFIQKAQRHLNPTHELVVMAWCFIETIIRPNLETFRSPDAYKVLPHIAIQDYQLLRQYCEVSEKHFEALRPGLWLDRGVVLFQKFYATFALASKEYQENRIQKKPFVHQILRSMKSLQDSLAILQTYEGYNATDSVNRLTQDAIWTLATVKTFIAKFMQDNVASFAMKSRSVDI